MNKVFPVYTVEAQCQDCYKCLRQCPVKASKVDKGRVVVIPESCIACGRCVEVCPAGAKRIRNDLGRVRHMLGSRKQVLFPSRRPGRRPSQTLNPPRWCAHSKNWALSASAKLRWVLSGSTGRSESSQNRRPPAECFAGKR